MIAVKSLEAVARLQWISAISTARVWETNCCTDVRSREVEA